MNTKALTRLTVDFFMSALMILLMAYQVVGDVAHEVLGTVIGVLFIAHAYLNRRWFSSFYKGRLTPVRAIQTVCIVLVVLDAIVVLATGVMISGTVFAFLNIVSGIAVARTLHICAGFWGLVLMSCHVGIHWNSVMAMTRSVLGTKPRSGPALLAARLLALAIALHGAWAFKHFQVWQYLTLRMQFAFFDDLGNIRTLFNWTSVMALFVFASYWLTKAVQAASARGKARP